jgi:hypothetical protein
MKSEHVTDLLHDYVDGSLSPGSASKVTLHFESCPSCSKAFNELRALRRSLSLWPAPSPRTGVLERMLNVAVRTPVASVPWWRRRIWNRAGLSAAAFLLLMLGFGLGLRTVHRELPGPQIMLAAQPVELSPEGQTVGLIFRASDVLQNASISVWLPDDVRIAGRPNVRHLSWQTDLKRGPNLLELPLFATGPRGGTLLVHLSRGSFVRTLEVPITIRLPKVPAASYESQRNSSALI